MKHFISVSSSVTSFLLWALTCTAQHAAVTDVEIRGPAVFNASEFGGIAYLGHLELRYRPRQDIAKVRATADTSVDLEKGVCLVVTLENRGEIQLTIGEREEFDELSFDVQRSPGNGSVTYMPVEPRPTKPRAPIGSCHEGWIEPSTTMTWKVPFKNFYDLSPGTYRAAVTIRFWVGASRHSFFTSITTPPVEFVVPQKENNHTGLDAGRNLDGNWGRPNGGYQLSLELENKEFVRGELMVATLVFKNVTNREVATPYEIVRLGSDALETKIVIRDANNNVLKRKDVKEDRSFRERLAALNKNRHYYVLSPQLERRYHVALDQLFDLAPGTYSALFEFHVSSGTNVTVAQSNAVRFNVIERK